MNLIEFFGTTIKPKKVKGKKMMSPLITSKIDENIFAIKDKDVNAFLIKSESGFIAIDSGYKNSENMKKGLLDLGINSDEVNSVLLTHLDLDHAGGVDSHSNQIYPKAKIYLGDEEVKYLDKTYARKTILGIKLASPIKLNPGYILLKNEEEFSLDGVKIKVFLTPGHTLGHVSYLINEKYLFVGDTLILDKNDNGYCFWDFWNIDSSLNKASLIKLKAIAQNPSVKYIITSHNGYTLNKENAFKYIDKYIDRNKKGFIFRDDAPIDPYHD